jgi:hypothetical protein
MNAVAVSIPDLSSPEFEYARLIAELNAVVGFDDVQLAQVAGSMDLEVSDVQALIDRAEMEFELGKASLFGGVVECRFVQATYVSKWDGGDIETNCVINLENQTIHNVEIADSDCVFDHLESEHVELTLNGTTHIIEAQSGEFTDDGKTALATILAQ